MMEYDFGWRETPVRKGLNNKSPNENKILKYNFDFIAMYFTKSVSVKKIRLHETFIFLVLSMLNMKRFF